MIDIAFTKFFKEHRQRIKQFGSRSDAIKFWASVILKFYFLHATIGRLHAF